MKLRGASWTMALAVAMGVVPSRDVRADSVDPGKYGWLTRYASTNEAAWDRRFATLVGGIAPRFTFDDHVSWPRLVDRFIAGLGGPPDPIRIVDDRYLVLGACVPHDCGSKSFLWIDPIDDLRIGAVAGKSYTDHRATMTVFSRSVGCDHLPSAFRSALSGWIAGNEMIVVESRFVGPNGREDKRCLDR